MKKYMVVAIISLIVGVALFFIFNKQEETSIVQGDRMNLSFNKVYPEQPNNANNNTIIAIPQGEPFYTFDLTLKTLAPLEK